MKQSESRREETRIRGNEDERSDEIQDGGEIEKEEGQEQGEYRNEDKPSVPPCLRVFVFHRAAALRS